MPHRVVETEQDREDLTRVLGAQKLPFTAHWEKGKNRSHEQNRLAFQWYLDIARDLADRDHTEVRAECKLTLGVPILRAENEAFRLQYDRIIRPLSYPEKLALMVEPIDLPVTRMFNVAQMTAYLDAIQKRFLPMGVRLTDPEALR